MGPVLGPQRGGPQGCNSSPPPPHIPIAMEGLGRVGTTLELTASNG